MPRPTLYLMPCKQGTAIELSMRTKARGLTADNGMRESRGGPTPPASTKILRL